MKAVCFFQGFLHILHKRNSTDLSAQIKKNNAWQKNQISVVESWGKKNEHEEAKRRAENNVS